MLYDPFELEPPKSVVKSALKQLQGQASQLLQDIAGLRQNPVGDWLIEDLEKKHRSVVHKIYRYQMYLRGVSVSTDFAQAIQQAKQQPISDFFPGKLRKSGGRLYGKCCFHSDSTPSFVVYIEQNRWHCFAGCGGGDAIDFVMKLHNLTFKPAVELINNYHGPR